MIKDIVSVSCIVTPSGETLWLKTRNEVKIKDTIKAWKEKNIEYENTDCCVSVAFLRMPLEKYNQIPATNCISWPESTIG